LSVSLRHKVNLIFDKSRTLGNYNSGNFFNDLKEAILTEDTNISTLANKLINGTKPCAVPAIVRKSTILMQGSIDVLVLVKF
jgi:hypothetical protein